MRKSENAKQSNATNNPECEAARSVSSGALFGGSGTDPGSCTQNLLPDRLRLAGEVQAHVVCDDNREYRVPYARLTTQERQADTAPRSRQRTDGELHAIAACATAWSVAHQLAGWSFQFDHATKRAGCCNYRARVISLAHAYARSAADEAIDDTLLHEMAHALVGKEHGHNQVWRAKAVALGCSGHRCHDVQFTPLRSIVTCDNACWVTTAEQR